MSILQEKLTRYRNSEFIFEISSTHLYENDIFHRCNRNFVKNCKPVSFGEKVQVKSGKKEQHH